MQIKAQVLRHWPPPGHPGLVGPFALMADPPAESRSRGKTPWRQSDLKRAIAAAEQAGLESYRVEISPDGTISIIIGAPADTADTPSD